MVKLNQLSLHLTFSKWLFFSRRATTIKLISLTTVGQRMVCSIFITVQYILVHFGNDFNESAIFELVVLTACNVSKAWEIPKKMNFASNHIRYRQMSAMTAPIHINTAHTLTATITTATATARIAGGTQSDGLILCNGKVVSVLHLYKCICGCYSYSDHYCSEKSGYNHSFLFADCVR